MPEPPVLSVAVVLTVTVPFMLLPAVGAVIETVGAALSTFTETAVEVVVLPAASRATAVKLCVPLVAVVLFQVTEYGLAVSSVLRFAPSSLNCTPTTPTLSEEFALTATVLPLTTALAAGAVMDTVGAV